MCGMYIADNANSLPLFYYLVLLLVLSAHKYYKIKCKYSIKYYFSLIVLKQLD